MSETTPQLSPEEEAEIDATIAAVIEAGSDQPENPKGVGETDTLAEAPAPEVVAPKPKGRKPKPSVEAPVVEAEDAKTDEGHTVALVDDQVLPENLEVEGQPAPATNATVVDVATKPAKRKPFAWVVTYAHDDGREVVLEYDNLNTYKVKKGARALLMSGDRPMGA